MLAKTYKEVDRQLNLWKETERHSNELIQSLTSPLEQLHACEKACFTRSPLDDFEGLKEKLQYKLLKQTEYIMTKLQENLNTFKTVSKKMSTLWSSSLEVYTLHSSFLPMSVVCEGTPTRPSIADLLEWLSDLERIHNELYEDKVDILGRITYMAPLANVHKAVREWCSTHDRHAHKIRDIMEQVGVFLANRT
ncbi:hypothetical protein ACROYT_G003034 [Oculina patagonica]